MPPYRKGTPEYIEWKQSPEGIAWMERVIVSNRNLAKDPEWRRKVKEAAIRRSRDPRWKRNKAIGYRGESYEQKMRGAFARKLMKIHTEYQAKHKKK